MIIRTEDIKDLCAKILTAVDSSDLTALTETLQLKTEGSFLLLSVTNREYYAQVKFDMREEEKFHATVNANLFLKLIAQTTSETIELTTTDTTLVVKGNGTYKLPLIFDGDKLLELPVIDINNVTNTFEIDTEILTSIMNYNTKQLSVGTPIKPVQRLYYVDEKGCITFTSGACVNSFTLAQPVKLLLNQKLVKLFKLFKDKKVNFTLGYDSLSDGIIQTKVRFEDSDVSITTILSCDDTLINTVPVEAIRGRATNTYAHSINLNKDALLQTINRLLLFHNDKAKKPYSLFEFGKDSVIVSDSNKENKEELYYNNDTSNITDTYSAVIDLLDLKATLESCNEQYITLNFGDTQAFVLARGNVYTVIPEVRQI